MSTDYLEPTNLERGPLAELRRVPQDMEDSLDSAKDKMKAALTNDRLSATARSGDVAAAHHQALDEIASHASRAEGLRREVQDRLQGVLDRHDRAAKDDLDQTRASRIWARSERALQAGENPLTVIEEAADDPAALQTLKEELGPYLESKRMDPKTIAGLTEQINAHQLAHAPQHVKDAAAMHAEAGDLADEARALRTRHSERIHMGSLERAARSELLAEGRLKTFGHVPQPLPPR